MEIRTHTSAIERAAILISGLLLLSGLVHAALLIATGGSWQGPLSLRKPATFGLSFGLTLFTVVWVSRFISLSARAHTALIAAFTAASVMETALVSMQAWRGVPSHFNVETVFDTAVTRGLAGGGILLVVLVVFMTIAAFRTRSDVPASMRIALRAGFVALCGAMAVGGAMIARGMAIVSASDPDLAYSAGGFLKPMHAVLMHGVLILPAVAWLASLTDWTERQRTKVTTIAVCAYALVVVVVAVGNLTRGI